MTKHKNVTSNKQVRLSEDAYEIVRRLADEEGKTLQAIVDEAVRELDRQKFFAKADPQAWQEELQERAEWDGTLS